MEKIILLIIAGVIAGSLTGLTGANGMGIIITLLLLAGKSTLDAIGTCLLVQVVVMAIALIPYIKAKKLNLLLLALLAVPAVIFVFAGSRLASQSPETIITFLIILVLFTTGLRLLFARPKKVDSDEGPVPSLTLKTRVLLLLSGMVIGFVTGLVGGGGTVIVINALNKFFKIPFKKAFATGLALTMISSFFGAANYFSAGNINLLESLYIILPAVLAVSIASKYTVNIKIFIIKRVQGVYLVFISILLTIKTLLP